MSAFIIDSKIVGAIAYYADRKNSCMYGAFSKYPLKAKEIAKILACENIRSVEHRYEDKTSLSCAKHDTGDKIYIAECQDWSIQPQIVSPIHLAKHIDCLEYQSCECDDWQETTAYKILTAVRCDLLREFEGYSAAPWGDMEASK